MAVCVEHCKFEESLTSQENLPPPSLGFKSKLINKLAEICFLRASSGFLPGLLFDPKDGGSVFL